MHGLGGGRRPARKRASSDPTPVPPLAEQHRIVAKVDELMDLCDQLKSKLTIAQTKAGRLLESVLHNVLYDPILLPQLVS
jgi:type I restriction enzyme S subunit